MRVGLRGANQQAVRQRRTTPRTAPPRPPPLPRHLCSRLPTRVPFRGAAPAVLVQVTRKRASRLRPL